MLGSEIAIEVEQLPAFTLPAHPDALRGTVDLVTVEVEKSAARLLRVLAVQPFGQLRAKTDQWVFVRRAIARIDGISEQCKVEILIAVSEKANFQGLHHLARLRFIQKQRGHRYNREAVVGNALGKIEFGKNPGRKQESDQLIDNVYGSSCGGYEQQRQNDRHGNGPPTGQKQSSGQHKSG